MKNVWEQDIKSWARGWFGRPSAEQLTRTRKLAVRGGWDPTKYRGAMKVALHDWLTKWYTLSEKKMPKPATLRRNPDTDVDILLALYEDILTEDE